MRPPYRRFIRWMLPGLNIKRWLILAFVSMGCVVIAVLYAFGVDISYMLHEAVPLPRVASHLATILLGLGGFAGFGLSLWRLVRSIARALAPSTSDKPSDLIFRKRVLERGPDIVAIGGGTGLSTLLRGLKGLTSNLTAVVTVMDDGGSSGRLRTEAATLPPGDVRNCILALADDEAQLSEFFQHRLRAPDALEGHALGNLLLVGLEQATGGFDRAIEAMSQFLNIRGTVLPATLQDTQLIATMEDGSSVTGESRIAADPRGIAKMALEASPVVPYERVLQAIADADLLLLGPGSLFTSLIPNLLVEGIAEAVESAPGEKLLIANLMTQPGETDHLTQAEHLQALNEYIMVSRFDGILVNAAPPSRDWLDIYLDEAASPVRDDLGDGSAFSLEVHRADLLGTAHWAGKETLKHDPEKLAKAIAAHTRIFAGLRGVPSESSNP